MRPCPACGGTNLELATEVAGKRDLSGGTLLLQRCAKCQLAFQPCVPDLRRLASHYDYMGRRPMPPTGLITLRLRRVVRSLAPWRATGLWLDVGCGTGDLLSEAERAGFVTHATEISPTCCALLRPRLGARLFEGDLPDAPFPPAAFDVVTLVEVIEHLAEPLQILQTARRLLRPGGVLYLTTPHVAGLTHALLGTRWRSVADEHLLYFTIRSLAALLRRAGFSQSRMATTGVDLSELAGHLFPRARRPPPPAVPSTADVRGSAAIPRPREYLSDWLVEAANAPLRWLRAGDTLKAWAVRD